MKKHNNDSYPLLLAACTAVGFSPRIVPLPQHPVARVPLLDESTPVRQSLTAVRRGSAGHPVVASGLAALRTATTACAFGG
ncbi:hypothetical protein [Streptomyces sp. NPDC045251]|uniref:hypothetical protein n=1 Tax=unclassified Streptomyces TaxID=2593676 RepID=UPI0033EF7F67